MQMKAAVLAVVAVSAAGDESNPIAKVLQMINGLAAKVIAEGESSHKVYEEFAKFCEDRHGEIEFEVKTGTSEVEGLQAAIAESVGKIDGARSQIDELAASVAADEKDLAAATEVRNKEHDDFINVEKDLAETIDMLERAIAVIERAMNGGASFAQLKGANGFVQALQSMVAAEQMSVADQKKLTALVQAKSEESDDDAALNAPDATVYENSGSMTGSTTGGIADTLQGLLDTANEQIETARKEETQAKNNFDMKKQSLEDEIKYTSGDLDEAKKTAAASEESKATAEGDLAATTKNLNADKADLASLHYECMQKAQTYESEVSSRAEELKALATAKKIIVEATSLAQTDQTESFIQLVSSDKGYKVVHMLKKMASDFKSKSFSQLASRVESTIRIGASSGEDVFTKIREMTQNMIDKLEQEQAEDATQKVFCDKEMKETKAKKEDKEGEVEKLSTKKEQVEAHSAKLKEEVAVLQKELVELARTQAQMDSLRAEEKAACDAATPDLEKAITGIQRALKVLKDYYAKSADAAHGASGGAGSGIISLLEVAEADFSKNLSEIVAEEQTAAASYESQTKENDLTKLTKEADVKYKTKEGASLDKSASDLSTDLSGVNDELDAVNAAWTTLQSQCVGKAETFEERNARREAEIARLQDTLESLEAENEAEGEVAPAAEEAAPAAAEAAPAAAAPAAEEAAPAAAAPAAEEAPAAAAEPEAALVQVSALRGVRKHF